MEFNILFLFFFFCAVDAENVQRELEMLSQSAASSDSKPNSSGQARGVNSDLHSASHSQSNGIHSDPNTTKNIANGLPSKTCLLHFLLTSTLMFKTYITNDCIFDCCDKHNILQSKTLKEYIERIY